MNVSVTDHALARWRQRAARYADAPVREVIDAFRQARPTRRPPGVALRSGYVILRHEATATYLIAQVVARDDFRVVTVLADRPPPAAGPTVADMETCVKRLFGERDALRAERRGLPRTDPRRRAIADRLSELNIRLCHARNALKRLRHSEWRATAGRGDA